MNAATLSGGPADRSMTNALRAARLMGWASFGLAGLFLAAPRRIARTFGLEGKETLIRAYGAQEVLAGMGALSIDAPTAMWARASGDVIHIATTATGLRNGNPAQRRNARLGIAALVGFLAVDALIAARLSAERKRRGAPADYSDRSGFPGGQAARKARSSDGRRPRSEAKARGPQLQPA